MYCAEYHEKNKEWINKRQRAYYYKNHEKCLAQNAKYYQRTKKLLRVVSTPDLMLAYCQKKYNGDLIPRHELKKCTAFLIKSWSKEHLKVGKENKVLLPRNWKPSKIQPAFESKELLPVSTPSPNRHLEF